MLIFTLFTSHLHYIDICSIRQTRRPAVFKCYIHCRYFHKQEYQAGLSFLLFYSFLLCVYCYHKQISFIHPHVCTFIKYLYKISMYFLFSTLNYILACIIYIWILSIIYYKTMFVIMKYLNKYILNYTFKILVFIA